MNLSNFHYDLPESLIGQEAIEPRDSCKLMAVDRSTQKISHRIFRDLVDILNDNYVLVLNDTKVFPARLFGTKNSGGKVEVLLLKQNSLDTFECIARGKQKADQKLYFESGLIGTVLAKNGEGGIVLQFNAAGVELIAQIDKLGKTPLPPYIHSKSSEQELREKYQTVYAREQGSAAAPTAGLHFTEDLLSQLIGKGVRLEKITLHVGLGTFKPVSEDQVATKTLHSESFWLTPAVADRLNQAKKKGKKIIAVGTTTCRVLETQSDESGTLTPGEGETKIFIQPGYRYKFVDGLITNFHLPETSLLMLVTALVRYPNSPACQTEKLSTRPARNTTHSVAGVPANFQDSLIGQAYTEAIKIKYKFFSFGDAMIIL